MGVDLAQLAVKVTGDGIDQTGRSLDNLTRSGAGAETAMGRLGSASSSAASQLAGVVGVTLSVAGAFYAAEKATTAWYSLISKGISIVDDYQKKIIGTSYILTTMSDVKTPDLSKAYGEWKDYFAWLYQQSLDADKKSAASAGEIFGVSVELAKKGVIATSEKEMDTIGRLTDLMKAVTPTYASLEQQARGEIEAMISGTNRMGAQTAQILTQIDPLFKENIKSAREQGTVLEYIRSLLPQINQYTKDLMGTWDAVGASLKSAWQVINIKAFGDAHREIVDMASRLGERLVENGRLTADGEKAAMALGRAWSSARDRIFEAFDYLLNNSDKVISDVGTIASAAGTIASAFASATAAIAGLITQLSAAANNPFVQMLMGGALGSRLGPVGAAVGALAYPGSKFLASGENVPFVNMTPPGTGIAKEIPLIGYGSEGYGTEGILGMPKAPPTPPVRPFQGKDEKGGGAGKSLEGAENSLQRFIDTMVSETARGAGDTEAILNSWYGKQATSLDQLAAKGIDVTRGREALNTAYYSKLEKLDSDFNDWYTAGLNNQYGQLVAAEGKKLKEVAGNAEKTAKVQEVYDRKHFDLSQQMEVERLNLAKGYLDTMAGLSPVMADQLGYKRQALAIELQLADEALKRSFREGKITEDTYDQARAWQAVTAQVKKYNLEMENDKGLTGWAWSRSKEAGQKSTIKDLMGGAESFLGNAFSSGIQGVLSHEKTNLKKIGETMFQGFIGEIHKGSITKSFDALAKMLSPEKGALGGKDKGPGSLSGAGELLNSAGLQLITSAGGLALSGIGIMTNSQALVMAGTVLQMAGLAIQVYQSLTATTQMTAAVALTTSAGALSAAASMLMMAATVDAIPFFHQGGVITAHGGWPLKSDERLIKAQLGERVLSRRQNRDYEAGMQAGGAGGGQVVNNFNIKHENTFKYPSSAEMRRINRRSMAAADYEARRRG